MSRYTLIALCTGIFPILNNTSFSPIPRNVANQIHLYLWAVCIICQTPCENPTRIFPPKCQQKIAKVIIKSWSNWHPSCCISLARSRRYNPLCHRWVSFNPCIKCLSQWARWGRLIKPINYSTLHVIYHVKSVSNFLCIIPLVCPTKKPSCIYFTKKILFLATLIPWNRS